MYIVGRVKPWKWEKRWRQKIQSWRSRGCPHQRNHLSGACKNINWAKKKNTRRQKKNITIRKRTRSIIHFQYMRRQKMNMRRQKKSITIQKKNTISKKFTVDLTCKLFGLNVYCRREKRTKVKVPAFLRSPFMKRYGKEDIKDGFNKKNSDRVCIFKRARRVRHNIWKYLPK